MLANFPDSNFLYISYTESLAAKQTETIRSILELPEYVELFGITTDKNSRAKSNFTTNFGGSCFAAGAGGSITGRGAGIKGTRRFGGCAVIDDIHKPDEVTSDTMRQAILDWYKNTFYSRLNMPHTPILLIGQRLHEDDLPSNLIQGFDGREWNTVVLPALDKAGNPLYPEMHDVKELNNMANNMPYMFASQYQQNPIPAGGGIFKEHWFPLLEHEPKISITFITVDSSETSKTYNDATVFSFWGLYRLQIAGTDSEKWALHWIDCEEIWVEPKDLESHFLSFYGRCMNHPVQPTFVGIEKKSSGTTLLSILKDTRGLRVDEIERPGGKGALNKIDRFLATQPLASNKLISLPMHGHHKDIVLSHMTRITANDSHRRDDICDTFADAVDLALIRKIIPGMISAPRHNSEKLRDLARRAETNNRASKRIWS
jgi:hypothetical protein